MLSSVWPYEDHILRHCVELVLAAAVGVLLYYIPLCVLRRRSSVRGLQVLKPAAGAAAAGLVLFSCLEMSAPHLPGVLQLVREGVVSADALALLGSAAAGGGAVLQAHHLATDTATATTTANVNNMNNVNTAMTAMIAHSAAEGAGLGILAGSAGFGVALRSHVLHGVPDGMLVAMTTAEGAGLMRTMRSALLVRSVQAAAFYTTAVWAPSVSVAVLRATEGVALGSMTAMMWQELAAPAMQSLGIAKTLAIALVTAEICSFVIG